MKDTICHCEGVGVAVGVAEMGLPPKPPICGLPIVVSAKGSLEQGQTSTASTRANKNMAGRKTRPPTLPRINRLPGAGSRETGAQISTGGVFMNSTLWWKPVVNKKMGCSHYGHCEGVGVAVGVTEMGVGYVAPSCGSPITQPSAKGSLEQGQTSTASTRANKNMAGRKTRPPTLPRINRLPGAGSRETGAQISTGRVPMKDTMCHCEGIAVGDGTTDCSAPEGLLLTHNVGYLVQNPNSPTTAIGVMRPEGPLEVVRFPEQAKAATANTKATESMASREIRPHALLRINRLPGTGSRETGAQISTGGVLMKSTSSRPRLSATRTSLNIMFFLLMISCTAWPLALAADSEPMVSLPGGVPPQASQLLAAATPAPAGMLLRLRIYLNLSNTQAARQMTDDLQNPSSPNYHKWLKTGQFNRNVRPPSGQLRRHRLLAHVSGFHRDCDSPQSAGRGIHRYRRAG